MSDEPITDHPAAIRFTPPGKAMGLPDDAFNVQGYRASSSAPCAVCGEPMSRHAAYEFQDEEGNPIEGQPY
jgi:hypothetical protein